MPFDPTKPVAHTDIDAVELRAQFNALNDKIDAVPAGPPGTDGADGADGAPGAPGPVGPGLNLRGDWNGGDTYVAGDVAFHDGQAFVAIGVSQGTTPEGDLAHWRTPTITGPQGEVTNGQLNTQIAGTARNPSVGPLNLALSDPPTQAEVQQFIDACNALLNQITRV